MKKLAIIGASYLQLPLVLKAKEMGVESHCFAWEDGAVCKEVADYFYPNSILDKEEILAVCQSVKVDGITSVASDAAVPTICYVAEKMGLISNQYTDALVATDKYKMRQAFYKNGVCSPQFVFGEDVMFTDLKYPVIVKPTDRSGSRGVLKIERKEDLSNAISRAKKESFSHQAIVEEYISGKEVSVETISYKGVHYILAITDKVTTGEPYFVELEHHQPSMLSDYIQEKIKLETLKALNALNVLYGASHTEIKITEDGEVYLIEVGARMGGDFIGSDLVQLSTGYDFLKGVILITFGEFEEPVFSKQKCSGVYFLSKETETIKNIIKNSDKYLGIVKAEITDEHLRNIESSSDRSGYFIYQSEEKQIINTLNLLKS